MHPLRLLAAVGAVSLAVALSGCATHVQPTPDPTALGPIDDYLAYAWGGHLAPAEQEARWAEQQRETETYVADCMQDEGFEYIPNLPKPVDAAPEPGDSDDVYDPESERWVSQYGYGIVVSPWGDVAVDPIPLPGVEDPNAEYVNSLTESEQQAYTEALYGATPTKKVNPDEGSSWQDAGCYGAAQHALGTRDVQQDAEFAPLLEAIDTFRSSVGTDDAFARLDERWSTCMADAGHGGFSTQPDAAASIATAYAELFMDAGDTGLDATDPKVIALGEEEIVLALADLQCRKDVDYLGAQRRIQLDLERAFVEEHRAEFEAFKAAAEQAG